MTQETPESTGPMVAVPFEVWAKLMREASAETFLAAQRAASPVFAGLVWTDRDISTLLRMHTSRPLAQHEVAALVSEVAAQWSWSRELAQPITASLSACAESVVKAHTAPTLKFEVGGLVRERDADGVIRKLDMREVSIAVPSPTLSVKEGNCS